MTNPAAGTIRSALRYPAFRWLLSALAVSQVGDWLYNLTLVSLVYQRTGSVLWAGVTTAARVVPIVLLGPVGGVIADRFSRRAVMVISDITRLVLMLLLAVVAAAHLPIVLAPVIAALATLAATPQLPAVAAVTPRLVGEPDLPGANAAQAAVTAVALIAGPALGGVLLLAGSAPLAFVLNAATFAVSALAVLAIRGDAFAAPRSGARPTSVLAGIRSGAAVLRGMPSALWLVGGDIVGSLVCGSLTVLLLVVARQAGMGAQGYGYLFAAVGVGGLAGTGLAGRALSVRRPRYVLAAALAAAGLPLLLLAVVHLPLLAIALASVTGAGAVLLQVIMGTGLQRSVDPALLGRVFGLAMPVSLGGIVAGSLIAPALLHLLGGPGALVACGAAILGYAALVLRRAGGLPGPDARPAGVEVPAAASATQVTVSESAELAPMGV